MTADTSLPRRRRRRARVLAALVAVDVCAWVLVALAWGGIAPSMGDDVLVRVAGVTLPPLWLIASAVAIVLTPALTLVAWRRVRAGTGRRAVALAATAASVAALAWAPMAGYAATLLTNVTDERFDAPDGTAYLLHVDTRESGMFAVYREAGPLVWRLVPTVGDGGEQLVLPGGTPCHATATAEHITVRCQTGRPLTYPR